MELEDLGVNRIPSATRHVCVSILLLSCPSVFATTVLELDVKGLVERSDRIIEARVEGLRTKRSTQGVLVTELQLRVNAEGYWKGTGDRHLLIELPGGIDHKSGRGLWIPGMPKMTLGEDVVLFLASHRSRGPSAVVGLGQGKFRVVRDARTGAKKLVRNLEHLEFIDPRTGRSRGERKNPLEVRSYDQLRDQVRAHVKGGK